MAVRSLTDIASAPAPNRFHPPLLPPAVNTGRAVSSQTFTAKAPRTSLHNSRVEFLGREFARALAASPPLLYFMALRAEMRKDKTNDIHKYRLPEHP
jgi:hypothetical protein